MLPYQDLPLGCLFLDFNSFFASVEQQENPYLRGKPMIVVPLEADTTFAIAVSKEAKAFGVKTGTRVGDAKQICPQLKVVQARPRVYKAYHEAIRVTSQNILPEAHVHSIDEMSYNLIGNERRPSEAARLAHQMKKLILKEIGEWMTCSVGIAPNRFLAKSATEIEKPNGLVILESKDLPGRMLELKLTDIAGINTRMAARLNAHMIFTVQDLYSASKDQLREAFSSIVGERWWYLLRGYELDEEPSRRKSLSHSHVIAPQHRNDHDCYQLLVRLISKAASRLRSENLLAGNMRISVYGREKSWEPVVDFSPQCETGWFVNELKNLWQNRSFIKPFQAGVTFSKLATADLVTPSLFDSGLDARIISKTVDGMNQKFGKNKVFLGSSEKARDSADEKIAFGKTWLFSEGKGDNDWQTQVDELLHQENPSLPEESFAFGQLY